MQIQASVRGPLLYVRVQGDLDLHSAEEFRREIEEKITESRCRHLVLNLSGVTFLDSSGLGVILGRYKRLSEQQAEMSIVEPTPPVRSVLQLSGVMKIIPVYDAESQVQAK